MTSAMGCGLGADVISAYSAYNFLQPGVIGYYRYQTGGLDPTDEIYLASFPGGHAGTARHFLKKIIPAALQGEYRMADILNSPVQWEQLDRVNRTGADAPLLDRRQRRARGTGGIGQARGRDLRSRRQALPESAQKPRYCVASSMRTGTFAGTCRRNIVRR